MNECERDRMIVGAVTVVGAALLLALLALVCGSLTGCTYTTYQTPAVQARHVAIGIGGQGAARMPDGARLEFDRDMTAQVRPIVRDLVESEVARLAAEGALVP